MKIVADIVCRFSVRLMLVAIMALGLHAGGASAYGHGEMGDCANEVHLSPKADRGNVPPVTQAGVGHVHEAPCTSACCNAACPMAVLAFPAAIQTPASTPGIRYMSVVHGADGIDPEGLSRPPIISPSI